MLYNVPKLIEQKDLRFRTPKYRSPWLSRFKTTGPFVDLFQKQIRIRIPLFIIIICFFGTPRFRNLIKFTLFIIYTTLIPVAQLHTYTHAFTHSQLKKKKNNEFTVHRDLSAVAFSSTVGKSFLFYGQISLFFYIVCKIFFFLLV